MNTETLILNKLDVIKVEIDSIKTHLEDTTLNQDDMDALEEAENDLKEGKTKRL